MKKNNILTDHTLIINQLERSALFYKWNFVLPYLPRGSFLVGGYIRDIVLGRISSEVDVDIVVPISAIDIGHKISHNFKSKLVILDKEREVVRIIINNISIDIANQTSPSIKEDLKSRDFSINSIAYSFDKKCLIDPLNGIKDIELSLLRTQSIINLLNDPLRILRCFRFVSELNFHIDPKLSKHIIKCKNKVNKVAKERINYELQRIIRGSDAIKSIQLLKKYKIFESKIKNEDNFLVDLEQVKYEKFNESEKEKYLPLFFLSQILDEGNLEKLKFSKSDICNTKLLRKWQFTLRKKNILQLKDEERFELHRELENILPALIFYLPERFHSEWLKRWRDKDDNLFHPTNFIDGNEIKKHIDINDGPLLGKLLIYLSMELAFKRLDNFDEAIYKAKQWIKQNAPKCD